MKQFYLFFHAILCKHVDNCNKVDFTPLCKHKQLNFLECNQPKAEWNLSLHTIFTFNAMQCINVNLLNDVVIRSQTSGWVWWCIIRASGVNEKKEFVYNSFASKHSNQMTKITSRHFRTLHFRWSHDQLPLPDSHFHSTVPPLQLVHNHEFRPIKSSP